MEQTVNPRIESEMIEVNSGDILPPEPVSVLKNDPPDVDFDLEEIAQELRDNTAELNPVEGKGNFLTSSIVAGYLTEKPAGNAIISLDYINSLASSVAEGATMAECCRRAGIKVDTFYGWLRKGDKDLSEEKQTMYTLLVECLKLASGFYQTTMLQAVQSAGRDDWRALAWLLERRWPELYGSHRLTSDEHSESEALQQEIVIRKYTEDQWRDL